MREKSVPCSGHRLLAAFTSCFALAVLIAPAMAQSWPARPVRIVAPFPPGGSADILGRVVAEKLTTRFKQNFIVDNRSGAGGLIGSDTVAKSAPDGYTLLVSSLTALVTAPATAVKAPYDPLKDFTHIALIGGPPIAIVVHPGTQAKNLSEFVTLSKSLPKGLSYGSPGHGSHPHLMGEWFRLKTGANMVHITYKGASLALVDVVAGQIPAAFMTLITSSAQIKTGRVRALGHSGAKRLPEFAEIPTFFESGYRDMTAINWFSLSGPAGMPPAIVNLLNSEVRVALASPDARARLSADGIEPNDLDARAFTQFVREETKRWTPIIKLAKL